MICDVMAACRAASSAERAPALRGVNQLRVLRCSENRSQGQGRVEAVLPVLEVTDRHSVLGCVHMVIVRLTFLAS